MKKSQKDWYLVQVESFIHYKVLKQRCRVEGPGTKCELWGDTRKENFRRKIEGSIKDVIKYNSITNSSSLGSQLMVKMCIY